jgi:uncharacterized protein (DUF362 family)
MKSGVANQFQVQAVPKELEDSQAATKSTVSIVVTEDRFNGVWQAVENLREFSLAAEHVLLKPNFNSADPTPGSTHTDVLRALVKLLKDKGAQKITLGDRSGMGSTREVMEKLRTFKLADELGFEVLIFDELDSEEWEYVQLSDSHWKKGFAIPKIIRQVDSVIQTCCLKTHKFGGHFTISLKNSVGLAAKKVPGDRHDYMIELHTSRHQRRMIAEINASYSPDLILLDAVSAFTSGGPATGKMVSPNVIIAGTDRIAIDAIGVAILRMFGTTKKVSKGKIFDQAQIARAVELGLGVRSPDQIEFITGDDKSDEFVAKLKGVLLA